MSIQFETAMIEVLKLLAIHSTWIIGIACIASRFIQNAFLKRNVWRITMVCLGFLLLFTFSGLHQWNGTGLLQNSVYEKNKNQSLSDKLAIWQTMELGHHNLIQVEPTSLNSAKPEGEGNVASNERWPHSIMIWTYFMGAISVSFFMFLNALGWRQKVRYNTQKTSQPILTLFDEIAHLREGCLLAEPFKYHQCFLMVAPFGLDLTLEITRKHGRDR